MKTPEQLDSRQAAIKELSVSGLIGTLKQRDATVSEQAARIAELEENSAVHVLAMKASKAMLQGETERADKAEAELQRINRLAQCGTVRNFLALSDDEKGEAFAVMMRTDKAQIAVIKKLEARADANEKDSARYRAVRDELIAVDDKPAPVESALLELLRRVVSERGPEALPTSSEFDAAIDQTLRTE